MKLFVMYMNESWAWRALNSLSKTTLNQSKFSSYITLVTPILLNQLWSLTIPAYGVAPSQKKTTQIPPTTTIYSFFFLNSFFTRAMLSSKLKQKNEMAFYLFFFLKLGFHHTTHTRFILGVVFPGFNPVRKMIKVDINHGLYFFLIQRTSVI